MRAKFTSLYFFLIVLSLSTSKANSWCGDSIKVVLIRYDDGVDDVPTDKDVYTYDSLGRESTITHYEWNGLTWDVTERELKNYWNDTLIYQSLTQVWRNSQWENYRMVRETYSANGSLVTYLDSVVYPSGNMNIVFSEYIRDINDVILQYTNQHWNGSQWINNYRITYGFDALGRDTLLLREDGDSLNWIYDYRISYSFDTFGNNNSTTYLRWNGTQWLNNSQTLSWFIGPSKDSLVIQYSGDSLTWDNYRLNRSVFDSLENKIYELIQYGQDTTWTNYQEYYFYFTDTLNDSSETHSWNSNAWKNSSRTYTLYDSLYRNAVTVTQNYDPYDSVYFNYRRHVNYFLGNGRIDYQTDDIWSSNIWEIECLYTPEYDSIGNLEYLENSCDNYHGCSDSYYSENRDSNGVLLHTYYVYIDCGDDEWVTEKWFYHNQVQGDTALCETDSTTLSVINCPGFSYLWNTGETTANITVDTSGIYTVDITDGQQEIHTEPFQFYSTPVLGATHNPDSIIHLCNPESITLNETVVPFATYQWLRNDTPLVNRISHNLDVHASTYQDGSYRVIVTTQCGTDTSSATMIYIHPHPTLQVTATGATSFCFGDSVLLRADSGFTNYVWHPLNDSSREVYINVSGNYTVTATDSNSCSASATSSYINVFPVPVQPAIYLDGPALHITDSAATNKWYHDSVLVQTSSSGTFASPQNGWYYVQSINSQGCISYSDSFYYDSTAFVAQAGLNKTICDNDSVILGGTFSAFHGSTPYSYSWSPSSGLNSSSVANPKASPDSTTTYYLTVTDSIGNTATDSINISVLSLPSPNVSSSTHDVCFATYITLNAPTAFSRSYSWYIDSMFIGSTANNPVFNYTAFQSGNYFVIVTDSNYCKGRSQDYFVNVHPYPMAPEFNQPGIVALCPNDSILIIATHPDPEATYKWKINGNQVTGINDTSIYASQYGNYSFVQSDSIGCETTSTIYMKVDSVLRPQLINGQNSLCEGDSTLIYSANIPGYSYEWWRDFNVINGADSSSVWVTQTGEYVLYLTSPGGCSGHSFSSQITVNPLPIVSLYQRNDTLFFTPDIYGDYLWFEVGDTIPLSCCNNYFIPPHVGDYYVVVTEGSSECSAASLPVHFLSCAVSYTTVSPHCFGSCDGTIIPQPVSGTAPFTFLWSTGDTTATLDSLCGGNYAFTMTDDSGCVAIVPVQLTAPTPLTHTVSAVGILCNGLCTGSITVTSNGGTSPYTYSWNTGESTAAISNACGGFHQCTVLDSNNCIDTVLFTIIEPPVIVTSFTGTDVLCNGECTGSFIDSIAGGTSPYSITDCLFQTFIPGTLCVGNYCAMITDANGCLSTDSFTVSEHAALSIASALQDPSCAGCNNGFIALTNSGGVPPYSVTWIPSTGFISGDTIQSLPAGVYAITVTDSNGCIISVSDTLIDPPNLRENLQQENTISIFPNPVLDKLTVIFQKNNFQGYASIRIYDAPGNLLYQGDATNNVTTIDVNNFAEGFYWIEVKQAGISFREKFVIQSNR
jgi:hypothetical protein